MKPGYFFRSIIFGVLIFSFAAVSLNAAEKTIHLRNERIHTAPAAAKNKNANPEAPVSGLFLVQFSEKITAAEQAELKRARVKLLRFVPEDAFVARLQNVRLSEIRALPFVQWVGPYRADHKLHRSLHANAAKKAAVEAAPIRVLMTPDATPQELAKTRRFFSRFNKENPTRFGKILEGSATPAQLQALAISPSVLWIEPAPKMKLFDEIATKIVAGDDGATATPAFVHQLGFDGSGVTVAVADSGLDSGSADSMHPDLAGRVDAFFHYGSLTGAEDEHSHGTHVAGIVAGNGATGEMDDDGFIYGLGVAPGAHIIAQRIFDGVGNYEAPPSFETLTRDAVRAGAEIGSNSWGDDTQGQYDLSAAEFDALVRDADSGTPGDQPYILEFSAGNAGSGTQTIGSPAVAKNVIATGAVENNRFDLYIYDSGQETMADFSSRGPCEDGRIKPDVVAPGTWIASLRSVFADDENAWASISDKYLYQGGTSQAGPHVSGAAAIFVQYYKQTVTNTTPSPALVKAALINSAVDIDDGESTDAVPNNDEGWGRVDLTEIIGSSRRFEFFDQATPMTNGQIFEHRVVIGSSDEPLKITLTYTDVPGFPAAIPALVNDLDLEVIAPDGTTFRGNQFENGESVPNPTSFDNINNVEGVYIDSPAPGEYLVRIHARNVFDDARNDTAAVDQDFALVISADIPLPGTATIFFDRRAYTAPGTIGLKLIDFDLIAQNSITIHISSDTETVGENLTLQAIGGGTFTGTIQTTTGTPAPDGTLQISHLDSIKATYQDLSPAQIRESFAVADLLPPVISNVNATNHFGKTVVQWQTDEAASAVVFCGTNSTLSISATNKTFTTQHEVMLENLVSGQTYFFLVISTDEAGNTATNNNGGNLFSFVARPAATLLLVDDYVVVNDDPSPVIPLSAYTNSLNQIGMDYEVWPVAQYGSPTSNDLRPFRIAIWRINDSLFSTATLTSPQQNAISAYVNGGGSFFISSMELLSRLGTNASALAFRSNVLQVTSFVEDASVPGIEGVDSDPTTSGIELDLDYSQYDSDFLQLLSIDPDVADTISIRANASPILYDFNSGEIAGVRFPRTGEDSIGRVVFLPFPLDVVPESGATPNNRTGLLRNILSFLAPGVNGLGNIALDSSAYTIPSRITVEVADSDLAGLGQTTVTFFSDTDPSGQTVTLNETPRRGLFRGFITLVAQTDSVQPGELRAKESDQIWVEYFDASANSVVRAAAKVDTIPAMISGVSATADYEEATVTWTTSKAADTLVQFGESAFLGRAAYDQKSDFTHSITFAGLKPDRVYYFQVVSRDAAGNTTVDNNAGNFYTFRTLRPLTTPWFDNFENSRTNWLVLDGESGTTTWQLGRPNNSLETAAHSPTNAWGSNLKGNFIDLGDTSLISPAVELPAGAQAKLRFWHTFDFSLQSDQDIYEQGEVHVSTNNGNAWIPIAEFTEFSDGWEQAEIDLSAFAGHVVRIGFYYGLFSLESGEHPGWLIDDISITASNANSGTIQITNNLAQARFVLNGPVQLNGGGWNTTFTNVPSGTYTVDFQPIPFYETPQSQTNVLSAGGTLIFSGNYSFTDANANGISDFWEQQFFGTVSGNRTRFTDSDADGASDYAEFIAGTNPTNALSNLRFFTPTLMTTGGVKMEWPSVPDHVYQVLGTADFGAWNAVSPWISATGANASFTFFPSNGAPYLFRLETRP